MRKILFVLIPLLTFFQSFGQDIGHNFKMDEEQKISWSTINSTEHTFKSLVEAIETTGYFQNIQPKDDYVICELRPYEFDYAKYGYSYMITPFLISRTLVYGDVKFEYKEGRYKVTIKNINFKYNQRAPSFQQGEQHAFEWWVVKNGKIKHNIYDISSDVMDKDFKLKTTFTSHKKKEDW